MAFIVFVEDGDQVITVLEAGENLKQISTTVRGCPILIYPSAMMGKDWTDIYTIGGRAFSVRLWAAWGL
jgi:hypothetical protein